MMMLLHITGGGALCPGKVRAKQHYLNDQERAKHMSVLLHGDGAFSGQGIVYETLARHSHILGCHPIHAHVSRHLVVKMTK